ncbi:MAG: gliding motility protein GldN [Bacteroidota bacterium]
MKKNIAIALFAFLSIGVCTTLDAQTTKKKTKKKTTKTAKQSPEEAARIADSIAKATAASDPGVPNMTAEDPENPAMSALVADTGFINDFALDTSRPVDGFYKQTTLRGAKPFAFPKENKNNVKFYKRLWREIDLTDSVNKLFAVPGETLMQLIMDAIKYGKLVPYADEGFKSQLTYKKVMKIFTDSAIVPIFDSISGEQIGSKTVFNDFNADSVTKFEIKEDIYFDKTRGRVITQIIGLAPVRKLKSTTGEMLGEQHPFWLYFPQCRNLFAAREVIDPQRDIYNISYDDLFIQRNFRTRIVKESNPADLRIKDKYPSDERKQKLESDRIERELNNYKKNLWRY